MWSNTCITDIGCTVLGFISSLAPALAASFPGDSERGYQSGALRIVNHNTLTAMLLMSLVTVLKLLQWRRKMLGEIGGVGLPGM